MDISGVVACVIPYLGWEDRFTLAQTSHEIRETVLSERFEAEAFLHMVKIYNSFTEVLDMSTLFSYDNRVSASSGTVSDARYENYPRQDSFTSWLGFLIRAERVYDKYIYRHHIESRVEFYQWEKVKDPILEKLLKRIKFLSYTFIKSTLRNWYDEFYLGVFRFKYPNGDVFQTRYLRHFATEAVGGSLRPRGDPEMYIRVMPVRQPGELAAFTESLLPAGYYTNPVAKQPFVSRSVMRDNELMQHVLKCRVPPCIVLRWLLGSKIDPETDEILASRKSNDYLNNNRDLLKSDPATFWEWTPLAEELTSREGEDSPSSSVAPSNTEIESACSAQWRHAISDVQAHLGKVFKPFTLRQANRIADQLERRRLRHVNLCKTRADESTIGAYIEVHVHSDHAFQEEETEDVLEKTMPECTLYFGLRELVLYKFES